MLLTEWNMEDAKTVWLKEGREDGYKDGHEEGREEGREEIVRNALAEGFSLETVQKISGFSIETIRNIKAGL
jgi:predicted transposase/invertase (TIGR01784 family)